MSQYSAFRARARGLVTHYTLFVLDLCTRRVHVAGSTPHPDEAFMTEAARRLTNAVDDFLLGFRALICDRTQSGRTDSGA
jgi:hypothetical protein